MNRRIQDVKDYFGTELIKDIVPMDIQRFLKELEKMGYAHQTIKLRFIVLNQLMDYACVHRYIEYNPCDSVKIPKGKKAERRELPPDSQLQIIRDNVNTDFGLFPFLLMYTGMRRNEALALKYEDITDGSIRVDKALVWDGGQVILSDVKSASSRRTVPLLKPLADVLPDVARGYIFCREDGTPLTKGAFDNKWRQYVKRTGLTITPHQLRYAYATVCCEAGLQVKDAQKLLGHSKAEVTQNIYQHISDNRSEKNAQALADFVSEKIRHLTENKTLYKPK